MNWYKKAQENKKIEIQGKTLYKGKYPKIFIQIPNLPERFFYYIRNDVKNEINNLINEEGQKWLLKLKSTMKKKTGSGDITWLMFHKFKNKKNTYWVDPIMIPTIKEGLQRLEYDTSGLSEYSRPIETPPPNIKKYEINDNNISIIFDGAITPKIKREIKRAGFFGKKVGNEYIWTTKSENIYDKIYALNTLENLEINVSQLINDFILKFSKIIQNMSINDIIELDNQIYGNSTFTQTIKNIIQKHLNQYIDLETGEIKDKSII